ncbi:MAG TPA: DUF3093 domain-containing protein [Microbacteriaceae bacterium]|jgi:hypothetical protein|nr:DUF3093 domain-containing protein [Microbacteriaceae bacterium]
MTIYRERLWASPWVFLSTALVIPASLLVFLPINRIAGVIVAIALYAACVAILIATSPVVEVTSEHFAAGRARLPLEFVGAAQGFEGDEATLERGQRLDARAWLLIRGWISPVVTVQVTDANDPTPYWLVSTRRPGELVKALAEARAQHSRS